ncbi:hypothetical protein [Streptomyces sp. PTY087I2]|uniref:hypothetical protein n=1 Tax=Streptomyces sp. PTY087I2 TaxID=1819298 RepID=UPI000828F1F2|nr:hypothetical protein [Streptomyces sp. PTY087I2]OCC10792.1 hypothetical protein A3Q37_03296 [Streptomyces sp. PTY087I2]
MNRLLKAVAATAILACVAVVALGLTARVPAQSESGSLLRTAVGGLLAVLTIGWFLFIRNLFRSGAGKRK